MGRSRRSERGLTFVELMATTIMLMILASVIVPLAKSTHRKAKELELNRALRDIRNAIDDYKARCGIAGPDGKQFAAHDDCYPRKLEELTEGMPLVGAEAVSGKKLYFLRHIPVDPMTGTTDWGLRSSRQAPDSTSWDNFDVFDVHTKSDLKDGNGKPYRDY